MWWVVASLVVIVAFVGYTVLLNAGPARCPLCKRINVLGRKRTSRRDGCDEEGDLRRRSTEHVCGRCGGRYWIVWDDFEGRRVEICHRAASAWDRAEKLPNPDKDLPPDDLGDNRLECGR